MNINEKSVTYSIYKICYILTKKLLGEEKYKMENGLKYSNLFPTSTNLCIFMRTFVWAALYITVLLGTVVLVLWTALYLPYQINGGMVGYLHIYVYPLAALVFVFGASRIIFGVILTEENRELKEKKRNERQKLGNYTIPELAWKYVKSAKQKVCPLIQITSKEKIDD